MQRFSPGAIKEEDGPPAFAPPTGAASSPTTSPSGKDRKKHKQQPRQLLSCSKCRERKVKCDRTKPCSACCARGHPKECHFILGEGTTFGPIQQSLELRRLRAENQRLKECLLEAKVSVSGDSDDGGPSSAQPAGSSRFAQRRLAADEPGDTIYFGTPSFASVTTDVRYACSGSFCSRLTWLYQLVNATTGFNTKNLAHPPSGPHQMFAGDGPTVYPFPTIWTTSTWIQGLYSCLEPLHSIADLLTTSIDRDDSIVFPKPTYSVSVADVEKFLSYFENNATTYPDLLALIFAILASEMKRREYDAPPTDSSESDVGKSKPDLRRNMFLSASMQALRQSSFSCQPTLISVQAMVLICSYLASDGRALDAWTLLGTTIRMAQALGLHRNPKTLEPLPSLRESGIRKKLWWQLLHMDQQYSMALGRPLGISAIGDCPFAETLTTDAAMVRVIECVDQITVLGRQIMGTAPLLTHRINNFADRLQTLLDTIPEEIQFNRSWMADTAQVPESPLDEYSAVIHLQVHGYLLLLNRQRLESNLVSGPGTASSSEHSQSHSSESMLPRTGDASQVRALSGLVESCRHVLDVFEYLHHGRPSTLIDWAIKQQSLTAAVVLLEDMQNRSELQHRESVEAALTIFRQLAETRLDSISKFAAERLGEGLAKFDEMLQQRRRSSIGTIPFPDFYSGPAALRRDSQISWVSGPRHPHAGYDLDLKSPEPTKSMSSGKMIERQQPLQQQIYSLPTEALQPRRATVTGALYPAMKVDVPQRPPTSYPATENFYHAQPGMATQHHFTNPHFHPHAQFTNNNQAMYYTNPQHDVTMYDSQITPTQHPQQMQQLQPHAHAQHYFHATFPPPGMPTDVQHEVSDPKVSSSASFPSHRAGTASWDD
ncbi:hypothetical protein ANO11243_031550 [Dothideomycetidae sp. 11243]|nr:hypothetical protein ANO11243_031550 [fungal sp. No.11243]